METLHTIAFVYVCILMCINLLQIIAWIVRRA